jgi:hypothetical protein
MTSGIEPATFRLVAQCPNFNLKVLKYQACYPPERGVQKNIFILYILVYAYVRLENLIGPINC